MLNTRLSWILPVIFAFACARGSTGSTPELPPVPATQPQDAPAVSPRESSSSRVWQISPTNNSADYVSSIKTHIQQSGAPGSDQADSSYLQTRYSLKLDRRTDITSIDGSVTAFSLQSGEHIGGDLSHLTFPVPFKGQISNHELHLESPGSTASLECSNPFKVALSSVQRSVFLIPLEIRTGDTWQDSTSSTVCNGPIPLTLIDKRDYRLLGETEYQGSIALIITRNERALFYGEGSQDQHRITIRGETLGTAQLYVDSATGLLLNTTADNKTTLSIEASGRVQQFLQTSKEITARAN